jgi:hypothetical protein
MNWIASTEPPRASTLPIQLQRAAFEPSVSDSTK